MQTDNRRFLKVFVFTNTGTELVTSNATRPYQLTAGQIGFHTSNRMGQVGVGTGATPSPTANRYIEIHQNIGDTRFGTVRTKPIFVEQVTAYYKANPSNAVGQTSYIGYDESDTAKDISLPCGVNFKFHIQLYSKKLAQWYNNRPGFHKTIVVNTGACPLGEPNAVADKGAVADAIIAKINATDKRTNDIDAANELPTWITATKVQTGTPGAADHRVGIKLVTVAVAEPSVTANDPQYWFEKDLVTFDVKVDETNGVVPTTTTVTASPGTGWAAELAAWEAESQGFDRVREAFDQKKFYKNSNSFIIRAATGTKYDYLFLEYDWTHDTPGGHPQTITEPYLVVIAAPTGTLQATANVLNSWLTGKHAAITL
jgi:hypothetical protein